MSEFVSASAPSGGIKWEDHKGSLLIVEPTSVEVGIQTAFGNADAVKADVYVLTGPDTSEDYTDALVFPKVLASQLRGQIGKKIVGRLGQGQAKPGQSAPWLLEAATPDDLEKAKTWQAARSTVSASPAPSTGSQPPF